MGLDTSLKDATVTNASVDKPVSIATVPSAKLSPGCEGYSVAARIQKNSLNLGFITVKKSSVFLCMMSQAFTSGSVDVLPFDAPAVCRSMNLLMWNTHKYQPSPRPYR